MVVLPESLKPYEEEAKKLLALSPPVRAEFALRAYQVEILDIESGQKIWTFLQVDDLGHLHDSFCPVCENEEGPCVHVAASYLWIVGKTGEPIHMRYLHSFWRALFQLAFKSFPENSNQMILTRKNELKAKNESGAKFYYQPLTQEGRDLIEEIYQNREAAQEGSLSYLSLSEEERVLWQEGKFNEKQMFEFSFWNDFGKKCFLLQDRKLDYYINFIEVANELPHLMEVGFQDFRFRFDFPKKELATLIPTLKTVKSSLPVFIEDEEEHLAGAQYDAETALLHLPYKVQKNNHFDVSKAISIGDFDYLPKHGFYPKASKLDGMEKQIKKEAIGQFLDEYLFELKNKFGGYPLSKHPSPIKFDLKFDADWNLLIDPFLFEEKDLNQKGAQVFDDWAFLPNKGFFKLEKKSLEKLPRFVHQDDVASFVTKYKSFLNEREGFKVFISSLEETLAYKVYDNGRLEFTTKLLYPLSKLKIKELGSYIYIEGQGFYQKKAQNIGLSIKPGLLLSKEQVPLFIRDRRDELKLIPHFFLPNPPVIKAWLEVKMESDESLLIHPRVDLAKDLSWDDIIFYDDVIYVKDRGFYELPSHLRLPENYKADTVIPKDKVLSFLEKEVPELKRYIPFLDEHLRKPEMVKAFIKRIERPKTSVQDFYGLSIYYQTEYGVIPFVDIMEALSSKKDFIFSPGGLINLKEINFRWLRHTRKKKIDKEKQLVYLTSLDFFRLDAFLDLELKAKGQENIRETQEILDELRNFRPYLQPDLKELKSQLRPYQETGVHWLFFLYLHGLSGLLCDDMGLGKTHQSMGLISSIFNIKEKEGLSPKILIVCPTSVMYHWSEKLEEFMPSRKVFSYHGQKRSLKDFKDQDILLTTYGILRSDVKELSEISFELVICDEIQTAKNTISRVHQALISINGFMRLGLTGTPIENNLSELRALFEIVLPGYMPSEKDFKEFFQKPIEKENEAQPKKVLRRLVHPFVLRRIKSEVLDDLPEKTEEIAHCDLSEKQLSLYNEVLLKSRERILVELDNYAKPVPLVHIFALLTHLKQICDHPSVFYKNAESYEEFESGKWNLFLELLSEALESGQKVVVFSQYLTMLDIMELHLKKHNINFASLRGATVKRGEEVIRFNKDPECKVFLSSLLAGGLGIDLTAGSIVIHYDRWWNAAKENQATDRVHRFGQKRGVQVFKLVTKNSFEERIDAIIQRKAMLFKEVITQDDFRFMKEFDRNDLKALLEFASLET